MRETVMGSSDAFAAQTLPSYRAAEAQRDADFRRAAAERTVGSRSLTAGRRLAGILGFGTTGSLRAA